MKIRYIYKFPEEEQLYELVKLNNKIGVFNLLNDDLSEKMERYPKGIFPVCAVICNIINELVPYKN